MPKQRNSRRLNARRRRRTSRRSTRSGMHYVEAIPFSIQLGTSSSLTLATLPGRPPRCNWRPWLITISATAGYIPDTANRAGTYAPSAIQFIYTETSSYVSTSGVQVLGPQPRTVYCRVPPSSDWLSYGLDSTYQWGVLEAVCLGSPGESAFIRGVIHVHVALQPEIVLAPCPSLLSLRQYDLSSSMENIFGSNMIVTHQATGMVVNSGSTTACTTGPTQPPPTSPSQTSEYSIMDEAS